MGRVVPQRIRRDSKRSLQRLWRGKGAPHQPASGQGGIRVPWSRAAAVAGHTVLVTGLGQVGLGAVINGQARGARVICAGRSPYRRAPARQLGVELIVELGTPDAAPAAVRDFTRGKGVGHVIDCSAQAGHQRFGLGAAGRGGRVTGGALDPRGRHMAARPRRGPPGGGLAVRSIWPESASYSELRRVGPTTSR
ncbi:zinc-binding dehydrogenase [Streptomyces sp. NPDC002817]|uniref:zinc-binding dehydrogenase n=1 Tax=Streptomyces sp. NPDC088357 TaxID=3154655 RepID=UPI00344642BD